MSAPGESPQPGPMAIDFSDCHTVRELLHAAQAYLAAGGIADAAVDARHLVAHALGVERAALLRAPEARPDAVALDLLATLLRRRARREPVARIIGEREFYGLSLELNEATLDPRPDTETVVAVALHLAARLPRNDEGPLRILDLGTGTGAIALALVATLPDAEATATDISTATLEVARRNAERHGVAGRMRFVRSHWLDGVDGRYHLIVANPPYIPTDEISALATEVGDWDPRAALDGGPDGLDAYRAILATADRALTDGGWLIFEVGHDQAADVAGLSLAHGFVAAPLDWPLLRDLGGKIRCVAVATPHWGNKKTLGIEARSV